MNARAPSRFSVGGLRRPLPAVACLLVMAAVTSCAPDATGASSTAQDFHEAVRSSDWSAACGVLQPDTRRQAAERNGGSCESALESLQLSAAGTLMNTEAYGREALVEFDGDVVFMAFSGSAWRVTAAGCSPRGDSPYSCEVGGK
ncbi:hypothetical protein M1D93_08975 [Arthrobacter sp. Z1-9]